MIQDTAPEPGKKQALALSIGVHLLLVLALFLGVQWKTEHAAVEVELWSDIPRPAISPPPPATQPKPTPKPEVTPEPAPMKKADIVVKDGKKKEEKPKREIPPPPKQPEKPNFNEFFKQEDQRKQQTERANREAALREMAAAEQQAAAQKSAAATWVGKIKDKIRGNIVLPPGLQGNPEAVFEVRLLPDAGIVGQPRLLRSSGNPALDDAIERAILKSSPLPKPDDPSVFDRNLEITYRPYD
ncbi:MAG: TonB C-terminal domain-containing protein [Zoogloeaceae bacterium]|jgi:colicin import membrane protein|nr:TonB C-terminal domain-containing protein [Zoogloeaceae bacterium]